MKSRRLAALALTAVLALQCITLPAAFAADAPNEQKPTQTGDGTLALTQTYAAEGATPALPAYITQGGERYELSNTTAPKPVESTETTSQAFTKTAFSEVPIAGINNLGAYFPATMYVEEGDFAGDIPLDADNPYTIVERYNVFSRQVDRVEAFYGLPDNDVSKLPQYQDFEVTSSAAPGATECRTLMYTDVSFDVAGTDHLGLPNNYTAYVTYRGEEEYLELSFYEVTANYSGDLEALVEQVATTSTYTPVLEPAVIGESEVPLASPEIPLFPLAIAGSTVVVLLAVPILYLFFLTNARLIRVTPGKGRVGKTLGLEGEGQAGATEKEVNELICRRRLVLRNGLAEFVVPSKVDILDGSLYCLVVKSHFASREGQVEIVWQNRTMAVLPLAQHVSINFREVLITSTEAALMESGLLD